MRIRHAGQIADDLWLLGTSESCTYLLEGESQSVLINAGLAYTLPVIQSQIESFGIDPTRIQHLIILHAHFDHVGIAPRIQRVYPDLRVDASSRAWSALENPRARSLMRDFTRRVAERLSPDYVHHLDQPGWEWPDDMSGATLSQGDVIDLGGKRLIIYETPGHSSCSISAYVPELGALFPSDAAAIPYGDEYIVAASSSMTRFMDSLNTLQTLDCRLICADHYGVVAEEEAGSYIRKSMEAARDMQSRLIQALKDNRDVGRAADLLVRRHFDLRPDYFVDPDILGITYRKMLSQLDAHEAQPVQD